MSTPSPPVSESCTRCPHLDEFHGNCSHELHQIVLEELAASEEVRCPLYSDIRTDAMLELEEKLASST